MQPMRHFQQAKMVFLLALLACSTRVLAQSTQTGKCAACTAVDSSGTCPGTLPVCVDKSSGDSSNLPCAELIAGSEAAAGNNLAAQIQNNAAAQAQQSMPSWIQFNQPVMQQVPVPSAAELAAAQCPGDKPSKMCCSVKAFGQSTDATGQQTGNSNSANVVTTATSTGVNGATGTSQQVATHQGTPVPGSGTAAQTANKPQGGAGALHSSVAIVAAASFGGRAIVAAFVGSLVWWWEL